MSRRPPICSSPCRVCGATLYWLPRAPRHTCRRGDCTNTWRRRTLEATRAQACRASAEARARAAEARAQAEAEAITRHLAALAARRRRPQTHHGPAPHTRDGPE